jgi:hypothetical protein
VKANLAHPPDLASTPTYRHNRIHTHSPQRRRQTSRKRHDKRQASRAEERDLVSRIDAREQRLHATSRHISECHARDDAKNSERKRSRHDHRQMSLRCAPNAIPTPISVVRAATANDSNP